MKLRLAIQGILTVAWDNPVCIGCLLLLCTSPLFRVIVFFYPLLISTALCVVALVSVGKQMEAAREREIAGWNAKVVDGDQLSARLLSASNSRPINSVPGKDSWLKLVQGFEGVGSAHNETQRSILSSDVNDMEEGLRLPEFRVNNGRMEYLVGSGLKETERSILNRDIYKEEGLRKPEFRVDTDRTEYQEDQHHFDRRPIDDQHVFDRRHVEASRKPEFRVDKGRSEYLEEQHYFDRRPIEDQHLFDRGPIEASGKPAFRVGKGRTEDLEEQHHHGCPIEDQHFFDRGPVEASGKPAFRVGKGRTEDLEEQHHHGCPIEDQHFFDRGPVEASGKPAFRVGKGRTEDLEEQHHFDRSPIEALHIFHRRQVEAFREYERNFSFKTGPEPTAAVGIATATVSNAGASPGSSPSSKDMMSSLDESKRVCDVSALKTIPPVVLYNPRTGGTGRAAKVSSGEGQLSGGAQGTPVEKIPPMVLYNLRTGGTGRAAKVSSGEGQLSGSAQGAPVEKIPPMFLYNLRTGGTGKAMKISNGTGELCSGAQGGPVAVSGSRKEATATESISSGSVDSFSKNVNVIESPRDSKQRATGPPLAKRQRSMFEKGTIGTTPAAETQVSPFPGLTNFNNNAARKNVCNNTASARTNVAHNFGEQNVVSYGWDIELPKQQRSIFETGTIGATPAVATQMSTFPGLVNFTDNAARKNVDNNAAEKNVPRNSCKKNGVLHGWDLEGIPFQRKETESRKKSPLAPRSPLSDSSSVASPAKRSEESLGASTGKDSHKSLATPQSLVNSSSRGASPANRAKESFRKASASNSTFRHSNAVLYNAGSMR